MFERDYRDSESNFWISYADLMAGLLFVFILLIGAIISKAYIVKSKLHEKEDFLEKSLLMLDEKERDILIKERVIATLRADLNRSRVSLRQSEEALQKRNSDLEKYQSMLVENEKIVALKRSEISALNEKLLLANTKIESLDKQVDEARRLLDSSMQKEANTSEKLKSYEEKILSLSESLNRQKEQAKTKDDRLLALRSAIDEEKVKYNKLVENLQKQKQKIKRLTGIKFQAIAALKKALGEKIAIDKKTGSLKLASNILFEVGKSTLKEGAKAELKEAFEEYIGALLADDGIRPFLDKIIIEGHTDSDGEYIYNLKLSQERALAVMEYLLSLDFSKKHHIKSLMVASGRSYLDLIIRNGKEDKEASRRIEIKFRLKNEDAMEEIEKVLDEA